MILKYALFTLTVSIVPIVMILHDLTTTYHLFNFILDGVPSLNFEMISNVLSTGVFSFFSMGVNEKSTINHNSIITSTKHEAHPTTVFTKETLQQFTGKETEHLYLSILGNVFDVSKAAKYYGPGETYNVFTGRDGTRAFVTGDFTESGLTDDVEDLSLQELRSLNDWLKFYHKEYTYKGKLIGRYYSAKGEPTGYNHKLQLRMKEAEKDEQDKNKNKLKFPPCNVEWTAEEGSRVWCSTRSGGIERDWEGVPRKLYEPGAETYRCACVKAAEQPKVIAPETGSSRTGNLEEYEDCHPKSTSCYIHN